ncbi:unnamed protein product, partial [Allacma fusca]
PRKLKSV